MGQLTIVPGVQYAAAVVMASYSTLIWVPHQLGNRDSFGYVATE